MMKRATPYLYFVGKTEEAFEFYRSVFGGEFTAVIRYRDMPSPEAEDGASDLGEDADLIAHISLPIARETSLMGSDVSSSGAAAYTVGTNVEIHLEAEDADEARRVFDALSEGGTTQMPLEPSPWSALFGACIDRYGIRWLIDYTGDVEFAPG